MQSLGQDKAVEQVNRDMLTILVQNNQGTRFSMIVQHAFAATIDCKNEQAYMQD